jgi:hypothetical protein
MFLKRGEGKKRENYFYMTFNHGSRVTKIFAVGGALISREVGRSWD